MKFLIVFALAFITVSAKDIYFRSIEVPVPENEGRITNGQNAHPGQFYYQVGLYMAKGSYKTWCGGSFIGNNWVLTAAHCANGASWAIVFLGATLRLKAEKVYNVSKSDMLIHPDWNSWSKKNDISLIRIPTTSESGTIGIVKIPRNNDLKYLGEIVVISGWGSTNDNTKTLSNNLKYGIVEVSPGSVCSAYYISYSLNDTRICVATPNRVSACDGDSGGPLVLHEQNLQIGIVSIGPQSGCTKGDPLIITRVSEYLPWIQLYTGFTNKQIITLMKENIYSQSNERQFLKDFISGAPGSSGARLAAWLQPEPRLDPNKCELNSITETLRYGWPTQITVTIRDQYGDSVLVPELKVEIKAIPTGSSGNGNIKMRRASYTDNTATYGGLPPPPRISYEPTIKEKMCFKAITFMKSLSNYSFEELRFSSPVQTRVTETLFAQDMKDGTFSVHWTPNSVGNYCLTVTIDGILLEEVYRVEVKEGSLPPPLHTHSISKPQPPNKLRRFFTKNTAGLRIRSHPTLQSEQVGILPLNGIISFIDEIENDDGTWLRLSTESIRQHCTMGWYPTEAWCLQYNQHLGKTLLHPVCEAATNKVDKSPTHLLHKSLLTNIESPVSPVPIDSPTEKPKSSSPTAQKMFEFSQSSPTSKSSETQTSSTNPFTFPQKMESSELGKDDASESFESQRSDSEGRPIPHSFQQHSSPGSSDMHTSPTNLSTAIIAGVVGGGASKLQALQKWFKGDHLDEGGYMQNKEHQRKRSDVSEIASASVRELVRAMSGQESRSSANEVVKLQADLNKEDDVVVKQLTQAEKVSGDFDVTKIRATNFTPSQTAALLSTPKHTPRKFIGPKLNSNTTTTETAEDMNFSNLAEEEGLLRVTTSNAGGAQTAPKEVITIGEAKTASSDNSSAPIWPFRHSEPNMKLPSKPPPATIGPIKRAMPPSLAESIRAVFAAFLWHEGIVHDAMACASFLKFHPNLPKEGAIVVTRRDHDSKIHLSKEQKAQQRHSVEVANAGNYLNIRPSTLETLTKSGNSSLNNRKYRKNLGNNDDQQKLLSLPEVVTVLPPALRCLVFLWEQICSNCIELGKTNTLEREKTIISPTQGDVNHSADVKEKPNDALEKESVYKRSKRKKKDDGSWCEICEMFLPIPVTYHMRVVHPGCGKSAKGKGYNSVGIFCEGWAGNCGEGGKGASSWFLMCDACREKYMSTNKNTNNVNQSTEVTNSVNDINLFGEKSSQSLIANSEIYTTMRENANFLLELSSSNTNMPSEDAASNQQQNFTTKRSPQQMPVVIEHQHLSTSDSNRPSTSRNNRASLKMNSKFGTGTPTRKSFAGSSTEQVWVAPEVFACLGSLGAATNEEMPYEILGKATLENGFDRPLSEISYDSCDANNYDVMNASSTNRLGNMPGTLSKFHRSFSMGQGWSVAQQQQTYKGLAPNVTDENQQGKVFFRRRNNSISEGDGSLLICYPSENLRKLVPDSILITSAVQRIPPVETDKHEETIEQQQQKSNESKTDAIQKSKCSSYVSQNEMMQVSSIATVEREAAAAQLSNLLERPAMCFMTQKHELEKLRYAMKRSLRIATCRIYSLQALNWLLRSVTQSVCLHDLMWWFVSSLRIPTIEATNLAYEDIEAALEHPVSYTQISGRFSHVITQNLHVFLQSVADLTLYLPMGSPLQRIAIQCFGIRFRQTDHQFLHSAHVFGNISKILSKTDEQDETMAVSTTMLPVNSNSNVEHNMLAQHDNEHNLYTNENFAGALAGAKVMFYSDLQGMFELTVSSRQAMVESLVDNSTETFWESDEDDRNRSKIIEISMTKSTFICKMLLIHIDNSRDIQNKVLNIAFYGGQSLGDTVLIKSVDVDQKACGWISSKIIDDTFTHFRLELNGAEGSLRVRQIKLLGLPASLSKFEDQLPLSVPQSTVDTVAATGADMQILKPNIKYMNAIRIQQQICEAETLRVFRLITGQVFGKLICTASVGETSRNVNYDNENRHGMESSGNSMLADSLDLHTHMVGILFSRSKLSHLQKQVIVHIVYAIRKETQRSKEDWEIVNLTNCFKQMQAAATSSSTTSALDAKSEAGSSDQYRAPDTYCFEMLNLVLALSGSAVGRSYLSHQHGLLKDLLSLLHTGSDRVQRQVTALLRRILPEISPECFADILGVQHLPPIDYNIAHQNASLADFDMNRLGLLDVLLAVIAKSLQLQVKVKMAANKLKGLERNSSFIRLCNSLDLSVYLLRPPRAQSIKEDFSTDGDGDELGACGNSVPDSFYFEQNAARQNNNAMSADSADKKETKKNLNQRWFLNGTISSKQAESIIFLIRDLASGKLSQKWAQVTKAAVAESVLNLTRLDEIFRNPVNCIKTATLWLALASLCVLDREHVEKLSSGQWSKVSDTHPICSNHDDGVTGAIIQCESCGSLCGDCDRFLHLSRKTRNHKRTVCKEEEEAIRVELHESCGRIKLFWLLALADSKTLKAMAEFRDGSHTIISGPIQSVGRCRFCGVTGNSGLLEIGNVCCDEQCQEYAANSCMRTKSCGHPCGGVVNEKKCLPCLQHVCHARENEMAKELNEPKLTQDADDMCMICFETLISAPAIHLECGHIFHYHCCRTVLEKRWNGPRITFGFSLCPICKADIQHPLLNDVLEPINMLKQDVKRKALMRIKYEGVVKESDAKDLSNIAMDRYAYYVCFKCQKAYYGGEARCDMDIGEKYDPEELVCGGCSDVARAQMCPKHGTDFLEYKCRYCCSVAVFFCFGTTHFCDTCHDDFQRLTNIPKSKLPQCPAGGKAIQLMGDECPLHVMHPPTGEEFALGCGVCRNAQTF